MLLSFKISFKLKKLHTKTVSVWEKTNQITDNNV